MAAARAADPIPAYRWALLERQIPEAELDAIDAEIAATVAEAAAAALAADYPEPSEIRFDVLAGEIAA